MPSKSLLDSYSQVAILTGGISLAGAGGTAAVHQLVTGLSNLQKVAWLAYRVEYFPSRNILYSLAVANDRYTAAISASSSVAQSYLAPNASIYDMLTLEVPRTAAAATPTRGTWEKPIVHNFQQDPLMLLPQNIFLFEELNNTGAVAMEAGYVRIWYKEMELTAADWYDLLQLRLPLGAV